MELGFVGQAVRRWWWVVVLLFVMGAVPAMIARGADARYTSEAVLLLTPPSDAQGQVAFSADPDRYVLGQITLLQSTTLANQVAAEVGRGLSSAQVAADVGVVQDPKTDVVRLSAQASTPEFAQAIVQGYVDAYFVTVRTQAQQVLFPRVQQLQQQQELLQTGIAAVDAQIAAALTPYLPIPGVAGTTPAAVPSVDEVAPNLASTKSALQHQYDDVLSAKAQLQLGSRLQVTSQTVERATLPDSPDPGVEELLLIGGLLAGALLGCLLAVLIARYSSRVLSDAESQSRLGAPLIGGFPFSDGLGHRSRPDTMHLAPDVVTFVDRLRVRIDAHAGVGSTLIVVVGAQRPSGCTTLAASIASRYAAAGSEVLLVDADLARPYLTRAYGLGGDGLAALVDGNTNALQRDPIATTDMTRLRFLGGDVSGDHRVRRRDLPVLVDRLRLSAEVVVVDGGVLLESSLTLELARIADAIVVAIPRRGQQRAALDAVAQQLAMRQGELLAVSMPTGLSRTLPDPAPHREHHAEPAAVGA